MTVVADALLKDTMLGVKLLAEARGVTAACVYGSVARGDADRWSDIDLLVVAPTGTRPSELEEMLDSHGLGSRWSITTHDEDSLERFVREGSRFLLHVQQEGRIVLDTEGRLERALGAARAPADSIEEIRREHGRVDLYRDLDRFGGNYLFCLAHLFTIGKAIAMALLADRGIFEFRREHALERFAAEFPHLAREAAIVAVLRPFYAKVSRKRPEPLPFSYLHCDARVVEAVGALDAIAAESGS